MKRLILPLLSSLVFMSACSKDNSESTAVLPPLSCADQVPTAHGRSLTPEEVVDGKNGIYRLIEVNQYVEAMVFTGQVRSSFYGHSQLSARANAKNPVMQSNLVCEDTSYIPEGRIQGLVVVPLEISRRDGSIARDWQWSTEVYGKQTAQPTEMKADSTYPTHSNFFRSFAANTETQSRLAEISPNRFALIVVSRKMVREWDYDQQKTVDRGETKTHYRAVYQFVQQ